MKFEFNTDKMTTTEERVFCLFVSMLFTIGIFNNEVLKLD